MKIEENRKISNFKGLVTSTLDRVIWHTVVHYSSTSTYIQQISSESEKLFVDVRTDGHLRPILLGRLFGVDLKMAIANWVRPWDNRGKCHMD